MNFTREPLAIRAAIVAAVTAVVHVLVVLGVLPIAPDEEAAVAGAVDLLGTAVLVVWVRGKVTPVDAAVLTPSQAEQAGVTDAPKHRLAD